MRILAFLLLLGGAVASPASLVSYWRSEGNTNDSVGPNNGSAQGTLAYGPSPYGQGYLLDGNSYVDIPNPGSGGLNTSSAFTLFSVIRFDGPSTGADTGSIVNLRTIQNTSGFSLERRFGHPGDVSFFVNVSGGATFEELPTSGWLNGVTYTIAASFDGASHTMKLYRNGALLATDSTVPFGNMIVNGNEAFQIGRNIPNDSKIVGLIDEMRYYNTALTDQQVAAIAPVPEPASFLALGLGGLALLRRRRK